MQAIDDTGDMQTIQQLTIRGVDPNLWREIKKAAIDHGVPAGEMLNQVLREWLASQSTIPKAPR